MNCFNSKSGRQKFAPLRKRDARFRFHATVTEKQTGTFFAGTGGEETPAKTMAYSTARKVKLPVPDTLTPDELYAVIPRTQSSVKSPGSVVKAVREVRTSCTLKAK